MLGAAKVDLWQLMHELNFIIVQVLEVRFSNGSTRRFSAELLRACSPSAENCGTGNNIKVCARELNPTLGFCVSCLAFG